MAGNGPFLLGAGPSGNRNAMKPHMERTCVTPCARPHGEEPIAGPGLQGTGLRTRIQPCPAQGGTLALRVGTIAPGKGQDHQGVQHARKTADLGSYARAVQRNIELHVVKLQEAKKGFVLLPRRSVVESSFGWVNRFRRLARDYERLPETLAGLHLVVFSILLLGNAASLLQSP